MKDICINRSTYILSLQLRVWHANGQCPPQFMLCSASTFLHCFELRHKRMSQCLVSCEDDGCVEGFMGKSLTKTLNNFIDWSYSTGRYSDVFHSFHILFILVPFWGIILSLEAGLTTRHVISHRVLRRSGKPSFPIASLWWEACSPGLSIFPPLPWLLCIVLSSSFHSYFFWDYFWMKMMSVVHYDIPYI